jgi:hypothetical protein
MLATLRFNEVGEDSHCDRGERKTDGADDLAIHGSINSRGGERDSEGVEDEVEHFRVPP